MPQFQRQLGPARVTFSNRAVLTRKEARIQVASLCGRSRHSNLRKRHHRGKDHCFARVWWLRCRTVAKLTNTSLPPPLQPGVHHLSEAPDVPGCVPKKRGTGMSHVSTRGGSRSGSRVCQEQMDTAGLHALLCKLGGHVVTSHNRIRDLLAKLLQASCPSTVLTKQHTGQHTGLD